MRSLVSSLLRSRADVQVVGEAQDGFEAIERAAELNPDVIFMDIHLPGMNGFRAARIIGQRLPFVRILFLSHEIPSPAVLREVSSIGAMGFVHKIHIQRYLGPALDAALARRRFITGGINRLPGARKPLGHCVQFWSSEDVFIEQFAWYFSSALKAGDAAMFSGTEAHRKELAARFQAEGIDVEEAIRQKIYIPIDSPTVVSRLLNTDREEFIRGMIEVVESAAKASKSGRIAIGGEGSNLLCSGGHVEIAMQTEQLTNDIFGTRTDVDILCGYPLPSENDSVFHDVCAKHSSIYTQ
jgi:CheY-like chemotaxis protein